MCESLLTEFEAQVEYPWIKWALSAEELIGFVLLEYDPRSS